MRLRFAFSIRKAIAAQAALPGPGEHTQLGLRRLPDRGCCRAGSLGKGAPRGRASRLLVSLRIAGTHARHHVKVVCSRRAYDGVRAFPRGQRGSHPTATLSPPCLLNAKNAAALATTAAVGAGSLHGGLRHARCEEATTRTCCASSCFSLQGRTANVQDAAHSLRALPRLLGNVFNVFRPVLRCKNWVFRVFRR